MWGGHWLFRGYMWLFWIAVCVGLFVYIRWITRAKPGGMKPEEDALEVLKKRYAKGEIGKEEFEQKKKELL